MRLCAGGTAAQKVEKQHDQADYQDDVNEAAGHVKSEKPQQPKNDQNCGDYPEHFLFLLASRRERVRELVLANPVRGACGVEELRTVIRIVDVGAQDCLVVDTFGFSFLIWGFALLCFALLCAGSSWQRKPRPGVALCWAAARFCGVRFARLCVGWKIVVSRSHYSDG
jgi:hypothetical protein